MSDLINEKPKFLEFLSDEDQKHYEELRLKVGSPDNRYTRNRRLETLRSSLNSIREFCIRKDEDDWRRCLVCGIYWFDNGDIAINIRQLHLLIMKSKSTINGALAKMGYETIPTKGEDADRLNEAIPFLAQQYNEFRQWTIRKLKDDNSSSDEKKKESLDDDELLQKKKKMMMVEKEEENEFNKDFSPFDFNLLDTDEDMKFAKKESLYESDMFNVPFNFDNFDNFETMYGFDPEFPKDEFTSQFFEFNHISIQSYSEYRLLRNAFNHFHNSKDNKKRIIALKTLIRRFKDLHHRRR